MKRFGVQDHEEVLAAKAKIVAELLRKSSYTVAYTGAGISTAAGIKDGSRCGPEVFREMHLKGLEAGLSAMETDEAVDEGPSQCPLHHTPHHLMAPASGSDSERRWIKRVWMTPRQTSKHYALDIRLIMLIESYGAALLLAPSWRAEA